MSESHFPTADATLAIRPTRPRDGVDQYIIDRRTLARLALALRNGNLIEREGLMRELCRLMQVEADP